MKDQYDRRSYVIIPKICKLYESISLLIFDEVPQNSLDVVAGMVGLLHAVPADDGHARFV